ncbi:MAG: DUF2209 family protein [Halobacteriota archaeon]
MVCAAVTVELTADAVDSVDAVEYSVRDTDANPSFEVVADTVRDAVRGDAVVVSEAGEFYGRPAWIVEGALGNEFKYAETIAERKAVEIAHHAAYAGRKLVMSQRRRSDDAEGRRETT